MYSITRSTELVPLPKLVEHTPHGAKGPHRHRANNLLDRFDRQLRVADAFCGKPEPMPLEEGHHVAGGGQVEHFANHRVVGDLAEERDLYPTPRPRNVVRRKGLGRNDLPHLIRCPHKDHGIEAIGPTQFLFEQVWLDRGGVVTPERDVAGGLVGGDVGKTQTHKWLYQLVIAQPPAAYVDCSNENEDPLAVLHSRTVASCVRPSLSGWRQTMAPMCSHCDGLT